MKVATQEGLILAVLGLLVAPLAAEDWPVYQQNHQRNAKTRETVVADRLELAWKQQLPGPPNPAWSGPAKWDAYAGLRGLKSMRNYDPAYFPIVVGDRIWLASTMDDAVHCYRLEDGEPIWQFHTDGPIRMAPAYADGRLYFGSDDGHAYCVAADTGELQWRYAPRVARRRIVNNGRLISLWPVRTGVVVDDGKAYFGASLLPWEDSFLCGVDARTGRAEGLGCFVAEVEGATMEGPLSIVPGRYLVAPQGRVAPQLFSLEDGRPLGQLQGGGGSFVVLTKDSVFHGPGNKTGWLTASSVESLETVASYKNGNALVVAGDVSFILDDHAISAANYVTRESVWTSECDCPLSMILADETLFVGGQDLVRGFDARSGRPLWSHPVKGKAYALAAASGCLLVSTDQGQLSVFKATGAVGPTAIPSAVVPASLDEDQAEDNLRAVSVEGDPTMKDRWVFQHPYVAGNRVRNLAGGPPIRAVVPVRLARIAGHQALSLSESAESLKVTDDLAAADLPRNQLTAAAWVRVDRPSRWGGLVGCIQDNGDYERGWLLGYENDRFSFAICGQGEPQPRLTFLSAPSSFRTGAWHHVAGVYDGETMRLYLDGREVAQSRAQRGAIQYPPKGSYVVGGYEDENEKHPLHGLLHEVRVYRRALEPRELEEQYRQMASEFPAPVSIEASGEVGTKLAQGPTLRFDAPGTATIRYRTESAVPTRLILSRDGRVVDQVETDGGIEHEVRIAGLDHHVVYSYEIEFQVDGRVVLSPEYECDTLFDFSVPKISTERPSTADGLAAEIVDRAGGMRGICLCLGCDDGELIAALIRASQWRVIAFDEDSDRVDRLRKKLTRLGIYGLRATIHHVESLADVPVTSRFANVVVSEAYQAGMTFPTSSLEVRRLLSPHGAAVFGGSPGQTATLPADLRDVGRLDDQQAWLVVTGVPIAGSGEWSHIYGTAANNHYGGETLSGARASDDLVVQWVGRPGARYQADRNGRKPPPLATGGRIFLQGLHRILALDQYNGTVLWSLEIPEMDRYNMPRDCGNWCADEEAIYLAVHGQCWKLSAETGELLAVVDVQRPADVERDYDWGFVAREHDLLIGSAVTAGTSWTEFWGNEAWYDAADGPATDKVCSDLLFAQELDSESIRWRYKCGAIVNSTVTIGDGTVYFVETRGDHLQNPSRRLGGDAFWQNQYLVALDAQTGRLCWERPLDIEAGTTAFYASYANGRLILVSSAKRQYFLYAFQGKTGDDAWDNRLAWGKGKADHGSHLSRPAIVGNRLFVRPGIFDLESGERLPGEIPVGGCGTYACTDQALFFRAGSGKNSAVWTIDDGTYTMWERLRPDCWLSTIPAGGMLLSPEGGGGCSCGSWLETSLGFVPRKALTVEAGP